MRIHTQTPLTSLSLENKMNADFNFNEWFEHNVHIEDAVDKEELRKRLWNEACTNRSMLIRLTLHKDFPEFSSSWRRALSSAVYKLTGFPNFNFYLPLLGYIC